MTKSKLIITPALRAIIEESSRKIFGNLPVVPYMTGNKLFKRQPTAPGLSNYYVPDLTRSFKKIAPDYDSEITLRRKAALAKLKRAGKGPPKKGHGKRAGRKK